LCPHKPRRREVERGDGVSTAVEGEGRRDEATKNWFEFLKGRHGGKEGVKGIDGTDKQWSTQIEKLWDFHLKLCMACSLKFRRKDVEIGASQSPLLQFLGALEIGKYSECLLC
jgi:hypothetical protein